MDMRVRGMTTADAVIRVPWWGSFANESIGGTVRTREVANASKSACDVDSTNKDKTEDSSHPRAANEIITVSTPPPESESGAATHQKMSSG